MGYAEVQRIAADRQAVLDEIAAYHAGEADHAAHGEVDAARYDDIGHAYGQDAVERDVLCDHQQGGSREEVLAQHAEKHHEDDEDDEGAALQECHYKVVFIVLFLGFHLVAPLLIQAVASASESVWWPA